MLLENPQLTLEKLNKIEAKIENNSADINDYKELDIFLSQFDLQNYIQSKLYENGFSNYQEFINYRNKPIFQRSLTFEENIVLEIIKQCITLLKRKLTV